LRHFRWPITYSYDDKNERPRDIIFENLVTELTDALAAILTPQTSGNSRKSSALRLEDATRFVLRLRSGYRATEITSSLG
jgi:hypothetical protein